jgi:hypothetical protein
MREISVRNTIRMWDTYMVSSFLSILVDVLNIPRPRNRVSLNFISMCVSHFLWNGQKNFSKWTFKKSWCFSRPFQLEIGQRRTLNFSSVKLLSGNHYSKGHLRISRAEQAQHPQIQLKGVVGSECPSQISLFFPRRMRHRAKVTDLTNFCVKSYQGLNARRYASWLARKLPSWRK